MMEVEAVWRLIDELTHPLPAENVALNEALGRTLAEAACADADHPPFDRSAMDGYAIRADDAAERFEIVDTIRAGESKPRPVQPGQAVRIFTGAELPEANLRVIMQENGVAESGFFRLTQASAETHVRRRGEDFLQGAELLERGQRIGPVELALLASIGSHRPRVIREPAILHFTSGDEIVAPDQTPARGQIRNSNAALIQGLRGRPLHHAHLPDHFESAFGAIAKAKPESADLLLFSGGASVGDHDFTQRFLNELGFTIHCSSINVRPGKPLIFASHDRQIAFGLPGNPVSHFACYHLFVKRALARLAGSVPEQLKPFPLLTALPGKANPRVTFWPGVIETHGVRPLPWNSSGHLASLLGVDVLIRIGSGEIPVEGGIVEGLRV